MESFTSIAIPGPSGASTCGYCSPPEDPSQRRTSYKSAVLEAIRLSCDTYQGMIDRGWRRSGKYCYKPDMRRCCCPQYTIKLDILAFKPSRSHRKLIHRWNRFVMRGRPDGENTDTKVNRSKGKDNTPFNLTKTIHEVEEDLLKKDDPAHCFQVTLEPSTFTQEKYTLFRKYQSDIHDDDDTTPQGFKRFLVESPLMAADPSKEKPIPYPSDPLGHLPRSYGSYHQLYRLDGRLVAMAVLDVLPRCVSSVYFMYDNAWDHFAFGKLSALREISLAHEISESGIPEMRSLYMGYYIYSCPKMRYKGEYSPSYLADPETYEWYRLEQCIPVLQKNRYACFSNPDHCIEAEPHDLPDEQELKLASLSGVRVLQKTVQGAIIATPLPTTPYWNFKQIREDLGACIRGLGMDLAETIAWAA